MAFPVGIATRILDSYSAIPLRPLLGAFYECRRYDDARCCPLTAFCLKITGRLLPRNSEIARAVVKSIFKNGAALRGFIAGADGDSSTPDVAHAFQVWRWAGAVCRARLREGYLPKRSSEASHSWPQRLTLRPIPAPDQAERP
jgi:hypothetical protein